MLSLLLSKDENVDLGLCVFCLITRAIQMKRREKESTFIYHKRSPKLPAGNRRGWSPKKSKFK